MRKEKLCAVLLLISLGIGAWWKIKNRDAAEDPAVKEEPLMLYYRVPRPLTKQVETGELYRVTELLRDFFIPYVCGQSYQGSWRGDRWVPVFIPKGGWHSQVMKDRIHRRMLRDDLRELGIEAREDGAIDGE